MKFVDSFRFMSSSLSSLVDNLSEGFHNYKCTKYKSCLDYISSKDNQLIFKCRKCSKNHNNILIKISLKDLKMHMNFVIEIFLNLFCY